MRFPFLDMMGFPFWEFFDGLHKHFLEAKFEKISFFRNFDGLCKLFWRMIFLFLMDYINGSCDLINDGMSKKGNF